MSCACLPFTVHRSQLTVYRSPLTIHRSPLTVYRSPFTAYRSPFTAYRSPFTVHRSPFTAHNSLLTVQKRGKGMFAKRVRDLEVYKAAFDVQQQIFRVTKSFPKEETYSLTDQVRRSSRSVGANICEAWGKRRYPAHFVSKLSDSDGESEETIHWIETAFECEYITDEIRNELVFQCEHICGMLNKMMDSPDSWCKHWVKS